MTRGDVIEVIWPFSDMSGNKRRPAVVMQTDMLNGLIDDTILVQITSTRRGIPDTEVLIDPVAEGASGLSKLCVASCLNVLTRDQSLVLRTIGFVSDGILRQIADCLKKVLDLP
jgi:mRNA interferase MazF